LFEATLKYGEPFNKNDKRFNLDDLKIKRFNKTSFAITGGFELTNFALDEKVTVS